MTNLSRCTVAVVIGISTSVAQATWTVVNLHPAGAAESYGVGVRGKVMVGSVAFEEMGPLHAGLWNQTDGSWSDLDSGAVAESSEACSGDAQQQVGFRLIEGQHRAMHWRGTAASRIELHPSEAISSAALAMEGNQQVGYVELSQPGSSALSQYRASIWKGSSAWIDLAPPGADASCAFTTNGARQGGYAMFGDQYHACVWYGSGESWRDLMPEDADFSIVFGMDAVQEVGSFGFGSFEHACVWNGTSASMQDLNPPAADYSRAWSVSDGNQAGMVSISGQSRAALWRGSSSSYVDLHQLLPLEFESSVAKGVWSEGRTVSVIGYGFNTRTWRNEAVIWVETVDCASDLNMDGVVDDADFSIFVVAYATLDCGDPSMPQGCPSDLNGDRVVDDSDFSLFMASYVMIVCP